ncbi:MAG: hypothetical protein VYC68_01595, partial [Candidatus Thermoplasmatota archaeon]|nr:hypothetical protein [Candidatus Thermoplasmatota archaeon]
MQESADSRNTDHECTDAPALGPDVARVPIETLIAGVRAEAELSADNAGEQLVQRPVHVGEVPTTQTVLEGLVRALEQLSNRTAGNVAPKVEFPKGSAKSIAMIDPWLAEFERMWGLTGLVSVAQKIVTLVGLWPADEAAGKRLRLLQRVDVYQHAEADGRFEQCYLFLTRALQSMQDPKDLRRNKAELALDEIVRASSEDIRSFHLRWDETVINLETEGVVWTDDHMLRRYMIAIGEDTAKWVKLQVDPQTVGAARKAAERWAAAETLFGKPCKDALALPGVAARAQRQ